ncbi:MAG TPA: choice-of-anchor Q domain-containing protein, partial [Anaerolineales bacterium]|nr:choice-of-anchor Q domain-containing protein [Anaerolineales bacterium]
MGATIVYDENGLATFVSFAEPERSIPHPEFVTGDTTPEDAARGFLSAYGSVFGLADQAQEMAVMKEETLERGRSFVRFQQMFQGLPVFGGELIVQLDGGNNVRSANGELAPDFSLSTTPEVDANIATESALAAVAKWYGVDAGTLVVSQPELWVYDPSLVGPAGDPVQLVWRMEVTSTNLEPIRELMLINAHRGNIALHFNQIDTAHGDSPAHSPALQATTRFVATTGVDTGNCSSSASPCLTINYAIGQAAAGDTIKVAIGLYTYSGIESGVAQITKDLTISGGWNGTYVLQTDLSVLEGQNQRRGIIVNFGVVASADHLLIQNGQTGSNLGGCIQNAGTLTLSASVVTNCSSDGGAIWNNGTMVLNSITIFGNRSPLGSAAGVYNTGTLTLNNSTVSQNWAVADGGGIYTNSSLTINNSTISRNIAARGGGIASGGGSIVLRNSIVAGNLTTNLGPDCFGSLGSAGYNIIGSNTDCSITPATGDQIGSGSSSIDPKLSLLQRNGGLTPTHALLPTSPAIDAGNP